MASLRERFAVTWADGQPVEVTSTVKDMITAVDMLPKGQVQNQIAVQTALIYSALCREGHEVPLYEDWLLQIDSYEKLPTAVVIEGPTQPAAMPGEQSPYRASQVQTGDHGLTVMTTAPSSQQSNSS